MASRRPPYLRASGQASPDPTALPPTPSLGEVDLRCRGCGARVTEWAADCPQCHRALDDATAIPHRPAGRPARQLHSRLRRRATKRRVIVAVATVFAVAAATTGFIALASTRRPAFLDGLPADLGRETLVVSGADKPGVDTATGQALHSLPALAQGGPAVLIAGTGLVIFISDGFAYRSKLAAGTPTVRITAVPSCARPWSTW